jgi:uracil-DNA glycosylase
MIPAEFADAWPSSNGWTDLLQPVLASPDFASLANYVQNERQQYQVYPAERDVFHAFRLTSAEETKVVILGQDPYHGPGQAHGLSFSVPDGCRLPPSLKNIFRELADDLDVAIPSSGNLSAWAERGVLLLNTVMTVRQGIPQSHRGKGWERFTDEVILRLADQKRPIVFMLWGSPARKKADLIPRPHHIIESPHPSPLSAYRGFFGSRPFSKANQRLAETGQPSICWQSICSSSSI